MHCVLLLIVALAPSAPHFFVIDSRIGPVWTTPSPLSGNRSIPSSTRRPSPDMRRHLYDWFATRTKHIHNTPQWPIVSNRSSQQLLIEPTGATVKMDCFVSSLGNRIVGWLRQREADNFELLTLQLETHTSDSRFKVQLENDNWRLVLSKVTARDSGTYGCQVSDHPPLAASYALTVEPPEMLMPKELFLEENGTLVINCVVTNLYCDDRALVIRWFRGNGTKTLEEERGGVLIETNHFNATSHLLVLHLNTTDRGLYTCAMEAPIKMKKTTRVNVLRGSSLGELQGGTTGTTSYAGLMLASFLVVLLFYDNVAMTINLSGIFIILFLFVISFY